MVEMKAEVLYMKIVECDENPKFQEYFKSIVEKVALALQIPIVCMTFVNIEEFLNYYMEERDADLIFVNVNSKRENSYRFAKKIRSMDEKIKIIFLTSLQNYYVESYDISLAEYWVKPIEKNRFYESVLTAVKESLKSDNSYYIETNKEGIFKIYLSSIKYIETLERHTVVHAVDNEIYSNKTMASHLNELDKRFIRCHSSIIVNMQYIKKYSHNEVEVDAGERLPISKSRRKEFLEKFKSYLKITFER